GLLFGVEGRDVAAGAEDLLADHAGAFGQAGPDGGLHEVAVGVFAFHGRHTAAGDDGRALGPGLGVVAQHLGLVFGRDKRAQAHARRVGATDLQALGLFLQRGDELVEDRSLHVHALGAQADLAAVLEGAAGDAGNRL